MGMTYDPGAICLGSWLLLQPSLGLHASTVPVKGRGGGTLVTAWWMSRQPVLPRAGKENAYGADRDPHSFSLVQMGGLSLRQQQGSVRL